MAGLTPRNDKPQRRRATTTRKASGRTSVPASSRKNATTNTASTRKSTSSPKMQQSPTPNAKRRSTTLPKSSQSNTGGYRAPSLWTKNAPKTHSSNDNIFVRILLALAKALFSLFALIGRGILWAGRMVGALVSRSRTALIVAIILVVVGAGAVVDLAVNWGKAYAGVHIGQVDVSGKTAPEIRELINSTYENKLQQGSATIYANEEAATRVADELARAQDVSTAEQQSVEQARANKQLWTTNATSLAATLPLESLAAEALATGREQGGIVARLEALFTGSTIPIRATYQEDSLEVLAADIDATIGNPRKDFGVDIVHGVASVTEGHDGNMIDRGELAKKLDEAFLETEQAQGSFVARIDYAPLRIDQPTAQSICDALNVALVRGARFTYEGSYWEATAADLGEWIDTRVEMRDGAWVLIASFDEERAKPSILSHVQKSRNGEAFKIAFSRDGNAIQVHTDGSYAIPLVTETVQALDIALFGGANTLEQAVGTPNQNASLEAIDEPAQVTVASGTAPTTTSFEEALDMGLISEISTYTTQYTNKAGTENRNHNIRLVSDLLNNSITKPQGTWSFNDTSGECNEEKGFLGAGAIINGEYDDAIGGGICQVATTVFNSIYESGFPVVERHNHSLYISSYPAGRDAAVSWEELDFIWKNDSDSDVLMRTSYTDTSVTIMLFGIDPDYRVSTTVGEWHEGESYTTKIERDEKMAPGTSYVKTAGEDGKSIAVFRTVKSVDETVLHEDPFYSTYTPLNEVVVAAVGAEVKTKDDEKKATTTS